MAKRDKGKAKADSDDDLLDFDSEAEAAPKRKKVASAAPAGPALNKESLKAAIWYTVAQIVQEEEIGEALVGLGLSATEQFLATLTELVYNQAENFALDLKDFAAHAGRTTVRPEDVKLCARKNSGLLELLNEELARYNSTASTEAPKAKAAHKAGGAAPVQKAARPRPRPSAGAVANAASGVKPPGMPGMRSKR